MKDRVILHSDLNCFFASVECAENPLLMDKAVAVVGDPDLRHGIILAKSEKAKSCGVKTGQVIWEARNLCPDLITIKGNYDKYVSVSERVKKIYDSYSDRVESFGIDECWLDVTGLDGKKTADEIRARIKSELNITASVGVSWNKIYAKLASDLKKPDATIVLDRDNYKQIIFDLPVEVLLYVGKATKIKLNKFNIRTIGDITLASKNFLKNKFGKWGEYLWTYASGLDNSKVCRSSENSEIKSVGNSMTTTRDLITKDEVLTIISVLSESVASRMRRKGLKGQVVHLDVVDQNFNHFAKQTKIFAPSNVSDVIMKASMRLFEEIYTFKMPIRSVGVRMSLVSLAAAPIQISFFETKDTSLNRLEGALDHIRNKFGDLAISRGLELSDTKLSALDQKEEKGIFFNNMHFSQ